MSHQPRTIRRALLSVYDKTGIVEFAAALHREFGVELISTGGTAKALLQAGLPVTLVETLTGFPELLDGRVKTLHPAIHAAILADRDNPEHLRQLAAAGIQPIDLVAVDLYPFERTTADPACTAQQAIEMIDIGGVALLRAAAKNHRHVVAVSSPAGYERVLAALRAGTLHSGEFSLGMPASVYLDLGVGALSAFWATSAYDDAIASWLGGQLSPGGAPLFRSVYLQSGQQLRYGENPHQAAAAYLLAESDGRVWLPAAAAEWAGLQPELSYNNFLDADTALGLCAELSKPADTTRVSPTAVFIKHTNACGVGTARLNDEADAQDARREAYRRAYLGDPNAAMGGILAVNFQVNTVFAAEVLETYARHGKPLRDAGAANAPSGFFVEVWIAPSFTENAVSLIRGSYDRATAAANGDPTEPVLQNPPKKDWGQRVRLLSVGDMDASPGAAAFGYRSITGGMLVQTPDVGADDPGQWQVVSRRPPTESEWADLQLAWLICKHTKSNAITLVSDGMLIGNGAGQMSRVMSCRVAIWSAQDNGHLDRAQKSGAAIVAASDAFFPFRDGPRLLIDAGVTAIIQPGGAKRDAETVALCDEHDVALVATGVRHFRH